jgi:ribosomal protein S18 acetylase RimI-like enzyme
MVDPDWQRVGLGSTLHERMVEYARERNVRGFKAEVMTDNPAMLHVLRRGDHHTRITTAAGIHNVRMLLTKEPAG